MIRLSKERPEDTELLVFDVRPKSICLELNREPKVFLGRITPVDDNHFLWESRWGFNRGEAHSLEDAQSKIEQCAKGMYK